MTTSQENWTGVAPGQEQNAEVQEQFTDYFAFSATEKYYLPDGRQYIEFKRMNEGDKKKFQDMTSSDMILERRSGDARMSVKQGTQRHELIKASVVDWYLLRGGQPVPFNKINLGDFLTLADPTIVDDLERAIRRANPWLLGDIKSEDIEKEIEALTEQLEIARKREAGEAS